MAQVAEMAQDPTLLSELGWAQVATGLENCLRQVRADEAREDFFETGEPGYQPSTIEAFTSAARMLAQLGDERLYTAFQHQLGEDSPLQDFLQPAVEFAQTQGRVESYELGRAAEEKRMNERERVLNQEYRDIEAEARAGRCRGCRPARREPLPGGPALSPGRRPGSPPRTAPRDRRAGDGEPARPTPGCLPDGVRQRAFGVPRAAVPHALAGLRSTRGTEMIAL